MSPLSYNFSLITWGRFRVKIEPQSLFHLEAREWSTVLCISVSLSAALSAESDSPNNERAVS